MANEMRDRLIKDLRVQKTEWLEKECDHETNKELVEYVADYLIDDGWIRPPCKVGDKVYFISIYNKVEEYIVKGICQYPNGLFIEINYLGNSYSMPIDKAFRTREEAEQKLKEMRGE